MGRLRIAHGNRRLPLCNQSSTPQGFRLKRIRPAVTACPGLRFRGGVQLPTSGLPRAAVRGRQGRHPGGRVRISNFDREYLERTTGVRGGRGRRDRRCPVCPCRGPAANRGYQPSALRTCRGIARPFFGGEGRVICPTGGSCSGIPNRPGTLACPRFRRRFFCLAARDCRGAVRTFSPDVSPYAARS
jgi:hypothetical protein